MLLSGGVMEILTEAGKVPGNEAEDAALGAGRYFVGAGV